MTKASEAYPQRIPPRDRSDWDDDVRAALSSLRPPASATAGGSTPPAARSERPASGILGIFAWHPELTRGWLQFNNHLFHSTLSGRVRELVTVRIAWLRDGEYEWAQHVRMARACGLTDEEIDAIAVGPDAPVWKPLDAALLRAVDELCHERYISDATWTELSSELSRQELMDVVFTVGAYDLLAMAMNTFGLQMDPGLQGFPATH